MGKKNKKNKKMPKNQPIVANVKKVDSELSMVEHKSVTVSEKSKKVRVSEAPKKQLSIFARLLEWLKEKQIFSKIFIVCFAMGVFSYVYFHVESQNRDILSYFGLLLTLISVYIEILVIRDHLWVVEGSMIESKKWRNAFFNPSTLRKQKFRKIIVLFFALIIFTVAYRLKIFPGARSALSFIGSILMITMVYYEILAIRDEVFVLTKAVQDMRSEQQEEKQE